MGARSRLTLRMPRFWGFADRGNILVRRALAAESMRFCPAPYPEVWKPWASG